MRRKILIALLAVGTVAGYGSAFGRACHRHGERRSAFEQHVARICLDAARAQGADVPRAAPGEAK